jgi:hypothetical protein
MSLPLVGITHICSQDIGEFLDGFIIFFGEPLLDLMHFVVGLLGNAPLRLVVGNVLQMMECLGKCIHRILKVR